MTAPTESEVPAWLHLGTGRQARYLPTSTPECLESLERGIVFVMAWWSTSARIAWRDFKQKLSGLDPDGALDVVMLDIEGMSGFEETPIGPATAGVGETAWVRNGIPMMDRWECEQDMVRANTRLLLKQP